MAFKMKYGKGGFPYKNSPMKRMDPPETRDKIVSDIQNELDAAKKADPWNTSKTASKKTQRKIKKLIEDQSDKKTIYDYDTEGNVLTTQTDEPTEDNVINRERKSELDLYNDADLEKEGKYMYPGWERNKSTVKK